MLAARFSKTGIFAGAVASLRTRSRPLAWVALFSLTLSGCALLQKGEDISRTFVLRPLAKAEEEAAPRASSSATLSVALPNAAPGLDSQHIILFTSEHALDFYADAEWAARLPEMVRSALVGAFENSGRFASVTPDNAGIPGSLLLLTEIKRFEARYETAGGAPTAQVALTAKLVSLPTRDVVQTFESAAAAPAAADTIAEVVTAFDRAFAAVQQDIVTKTARYAPKENTPARKRLR